MPGLGFDKAGNRLGRGRGYYDTYLERCIRHPKGKPYTIALSFKEQLCQEIPTDDNDVLIDEVLYEGDLWPMTTTDGFVSWLAMCPFWNYSDSCVTKNSHNCDDYCTLHIHMCHHVTREHHSQVSSLYCVSCNFHCKVNELWNNLQQMNYSMKHACKDAQKETKQEEISGETIINLH